MFRHVFALSVLQVEQLPSYPSYFYSVILLGSEEPGADRRGGDRLGDGLCVGPTGLQRHGRGILGPSLPFNGSRNYEGVHSRSQEAGAQVQVQNKG